eukprot:Skav224703  [mRNA]  locus=scaffold699:180669:182231:- [translate_table: standard]
MDFGPAAERVGTARVVFAPAEICGGIGASLAPQEGHCEAPPLEGGGLRCREGEGVEHTGAVEVSGARSRLGRP